MSRADQAGRADQGPDGTHGHPGDRAAPGTLEVHRDEVDTDAGAVTRVRATGELDTATAAGLLDAITAALPGAAAAPAGASDVVLVDLDAVAFCDSRGLSTLVAATRTAARAGASLRLVAASASAVARLLERTGMTGLLPLHPDVGSALAPGAPSPLEREVDPGRG